MHTSNDRCNCCNCCPDCTVLDVRSNHSAMQGAPTLWHRPFQCSIPRPSRRACTGATVSMPATAQGSAGRFRFSVDRGGTFTDVFAEVCALPIPTVHLCIMALCLPCLSGIVCLNIPIGSGALVCHQDARAGPACCTRVIASRRPFR